MPESEQTHRRTRRSDDEETVEEIPAADSAHKAELDSDVDSLLDEIDATFTTGLAVGAIVVLSVVNALGVRSGALTQNAPATFSGCPRRNFIGSRLRRPASRGR